MDEEIKNKFAELEAKIESLQSLVATKETEFKAHRNEWAEMRIKDLELLEDVESRLVKAVKYILHELGYGREREDEADETARKIPAGWRALDLEIFEKMAFLEAWLTVSDKRENFELIKLKDAYYHVFPERLAQDVKFEKQMDALMAKPSPSADPKKS